MIKSSFKGVFGKDPDLSYTASGTAKLKASLATERSAKVDGEWTKVTDWVNILAWGKKAEVIAQYFGKGGHIVIHGVLETYKWETEEGSTRYGWHFRVEDFEFAGGKQETSKSRDAGSNTSEPDDDIPF